MLKTTFLGGLLLGFAAVVAAAGFYPWVDHPRIDSRTRVLPNGGRQENFFVRLPVDRVVSLGSGKLTPGAERFPAALAIPPELAERPIQIDHFKVRDAMGDVIGVASRHTLALTDGTATAWSLTLPARGALNLVGRTGPDPIGAALAGAGYTAGAAWDGTVEVSLGDASGQSGTIVGGSREFSPLTGSYVERWQITGIDAAGDLQGTIELDTTSFLTQ